MTSSRAISLGFAALLALSLTGKLALARAEPPPDEGLFAARTAALLESSGFAASSERRPLGMAVYGARGDCRLMVREYDPHGTFAESHAQVARRVGRLGFVYRGTISDRAPKLMPLTEYFVGRELRRIGLPVPRAPILAVSATDGCALDGVRWDELSTLPR